MCVHRAERKDFILSKYQDIHFVRRSHNSTAALRLSLQEATKSCDIYSLIQLYAQRTELSQPLHSHIQVYYKYRYIQVYKYRYILTGIHTDTQRFIQVHICKCTHRYTQIHKGTFRYTHMNR